MISVIIPAHNEEKLIERCLKSIKKQIYKDIEIIVVCNACTDKTAEIVKKHASVFNQNKRGAASARNRGAKEAKGEILCFIDADSYMDHNLLSEVIKAINQGYSGGVSKTFADSKKFIPIILWHVTNFFNQIFKLPNGFFFCTKDTYLPVDENLSVGEDTASLKKARKTGLKFIRNAGITTSMRRFEQIGYIKPTVDILLGTAFKHRQKYDVIR